MRKLINIPELIGKKFNRLTIIEFVERQQNNRLIFKCKCDCKDETIVSVEYQTLKSGRTKSCGCFRNEQVSKLGKSRRLNSGEASRNHLYIDYKYRAKKHDIKFNLDIIQFTDLTQQNCSYCNRLPSQSIKCKTSFGEFIYNGIDRVDSNKGYIQNNCVTCCKFCNASKSNLTEQEFLNKVKQIYEHRNLDKL